MLYTLETAFLSGMLYSLMALGVFITFRILNFPDLTVDGSYATGGGIAAIMIIQGYSPVIATIVACLGGAAAGLITGLLHTKGKINGLLSGILMMIALHSINLRIMGKPNVSLLGEKHLFSSISPMLFIIILVLIIKVLLDLFFKTDLGLALRATGDNPKMISSLGANTDATKIVGISISNALVALSGALITQHTAFADVNMGVGMIVIGLASVIIGESVFGSLTIFRATIAAIFGSVVYRIVVAFALKIKWMEASDLKLLTAVIVVFALVVPTARRAMHQRSLARRRSLDISSGGD